MRRPPSKRDCCSQVPRGWARKGTRRTAWGVGLYRGSARTERTAGACRVRSGHSCESFQRTLHGRGGLGAWPWRQGRGHGLLREGKEVGAEGRSVCASWVPSPLFVASARKASPPGPGGPRCQSIVEYRRLTHGARGQTRGPPVPSGGGCVRPLSPSPGSRAHRDVWASPQVGRTLRRSESPSCSSSFQCFICFAENIFQQREQRRA